MSFPLQLLEVSSSPKHYTLTQRFASHASWSGAILCREDAIDVPAALFPCPGCLTRVPCTLEMCVRLSPYVFCIHARVPGSRDKTCYKREERAISAHSRHSTAGLAEKSRRSQEAVPIVTKSGGVVDTGGPGRRQSPKDQP